MQRSRTQPAASEALTHEEPPPAPPEHHLLVLQRLAGNQAVQRLLRTSRTVARKEPPPTLLGEQPVTEQQLYKTTDDKQWAALLRAGSSYLPLYSEIATLLQADRVEDVKGTQPGDIHAALRTGYGELKQGLNFVAGVSSRGQCGYLYDGKWDSQLPDTPAGEEPKVAIVLSKRAFEPDNKSYTLAVLRHELEHAVHNRMAANWLKQWRGSGKARTTPFRTWLKGQSLDATDRALVLERLEGRKAGTEALANAEGFMAAFSVEKPGLELADNPAEEELRDVADYWLQADDAIKKAVSARLKAYGARLTGDLRKRFLAVLEEMKGENARWKPLLDPLIKAQTGKRP